MIITFDVETLPCDDSKIIDEFAKNITPPGNIKLPASIEKWHQESGAQALADMVSKTSFDGIYGRIACIAWQMDDGEVFSTEDHDDEPTILRKFYGAVEQAISVTYQKGIGSNPLIMCGHNIAGFDLPFLKARSIILGIKPPPGILRCMNAKPWDACIADAMLMWNSDNQKRASMEKLCRAFGITGKGDFDGSMVAEEWLHGSREKVIEYCRDDVRRTREIYKRITFRS